MLTSFVTCLSLHLSQPSRLNPVAGSEAGAFIEDFPLGPYRTLSLVVGGHSLLPVNVKASLNLWTGELRHELSISAKLEAAAAALAAQAGGDAQLRFSRVRALLQLRASLSISLSSSTICSCLMAALDRWCLAATACMQPSPATALSLRGSTGSRHAPHLASTSELEIDVVGAAPKTAVGHL